MRPFVDDPDVVWHCEECGSLYVRYKWDKNPNITPSHLPNYFDEQDVAWLEKTCKAKLKVVNRPDVLAVFSLSGYAGVDAMVERPKPK